MVLRPTRKQRLELTYCYYLFGAESKRTSDRPWTAAAAAAASIDARVMITTIYRAPFSTTIL